MTTTQLAEQLIALCRELRFAEARRALYAPDAVSIEIDGSSVQGLDALDAKQRAWQDGIAQLHGVAVSAPIVTPHHISVAFTWDLTLKDQPRGSWAEIGVFQVKDGRVVCEQFFSA